VLGENGTLGRKTYHDIVLTRYLKKALFENNDWMTEEYCTAAIKSLCSYTASATLMQINEEKYGLLRDGIPVSVKKKDGTTDTVKAKVFNFEEPDKNHFLAVKEMKIHGAHYRRRTDIVGFVNGIPFCLSNSKNRQLTCRMPITATNRFISIQFRSSSISTLSYAFQRPGSKSRHDGIKV
jgi:type I restriction enzyme R subunit